MIPPPQSTPLSSSIDNDGDPFVDEDGGSSGENNFNGPPHIPLHETGQEEKKSLSPSFFYPPASLTPYSYSGKSNTKMNEEKVIDSRDNNSVAGEGEISAVLGVAGGGGGVAGNEYNDDDCSVVQIMSPTPISAVAAASTSEEQQGRFSILRRSGETNRRLSNFRVSYEGLAGYALRSNNNIDDGNNRIGSSRSTASSLHSLETQKLRNSSSSSSEDRMTTPISSAMSSGLRRSTSPSTSAKNLLVRYSIGEYVLISNQICELHSSGASIKVFEHQQQQQQQQQRMMLNKFGYPEPIESASLDTQKQGPFNYILATVVSVHYGEDAQYYTVRREDNRQNQRADMEYMERITTVEGLDAAKAESRRRRHSSSSGMSLTSMMRQSSHLEDGRGSEIRWWNRLGISSAHLRLRVSIWGTRIHQQAKEHMMACLNGNRPYGLSFRFTGVNFLVLCSFWYLFIDQVRLIFIPPSADNALAVISLIVWVVLVMELLVETFIRPNGYRALIRSEKAYLPSTVRYLNTFHLVTEMISLAFFAPEFLHLFNADLDFSLGNACLMSIYGPDGKSAFYGTAFICMLRLRIFGVCRHWQNMWINNALVRVKGKNGIWKVRRARGYFFPHRQKGASGLELVTATEDEEKHHLINVTDHTSKSKSEINSEEKKKMLTNDYHLRNASRIGSALFISNATNVLAFVFIIGLQPLLSVMLDANAGINGNNANSVELLNTFNLEFNATLDTCASFESTVGNWLKAYSYESTKLGVEKFWHLVDLQISPIRCEFQKTIMDVNPLKLCAMENPLLLSDSCSNRLGDNCLDYCSYQSSTVGHEWLIHYTRQNTIFEVNTPDQFQTYVLPNGTIVSGVFSVSASYNEIESVSLTMIYILGLNIGMTLFVILGLSVLRHDAGRLVLNPLRRMLKIVAFYAKNPLSPPPLQRGSGMNDVDGFCYDSDDDETSDKQLGTYETEQVISAVTKITDLLRKCWGVAGAGIISSNLATKEGGLAAYFNPTVPGKAVYALFAFVSIDRFNFHLHALKGDIMILINDIAAVLHEETYRWGYEDSGQCNKNLGNAFLMVYRIGDVTEVMEKRKRAEAVIFSMKDIRKSRRQTGNSLHIQRSRSSSQDTSISGRRGSSMIGGSDKSSIPQRNSPVDSNIDLSSLPGMRAFADRALLGLLKTFAGIHRDKTILSWNNDFRLGAGVGAMSINLNFGMDAGWAVEGAVGSMYKIDATYLSPHVNMASRMMSATKQYGVHFLLSQSVQKLLSENCQNKLRHVDTVTVKGSSVQQKIYTYDAKVRKDFFLFGKTKSQEDVDSDWYTPAIWNFDQDLLAMRNHISDEFTDVYNRGREEYLSGNWPTAIKLLKSANLIMVQQVAEEEDGYDAGGSDRRVDVLRTLFDDDDDDDNEAAEEYRQSALEGGDGPCQRLIAYMQDLGGEAPNDWDGYRPLTSK